MSDTLNIGLLKRRYLLRLYQGQDTAERVFFFVSLTKLLATTKEYEMKQPTIGSSSVVSSSDEADQVSSPCSNLKEAEIQAGELTVLITYLNLVFF